MYGAVAKFGFKAYQHIPFAVSLRCIEAVESARSDFAMSSKDSGDVLKSRSDGTRSGGVVHILENPQQKYKILPFFCGCTLQKLHPYIARLQG